MRGLCLAIILMSVVTMTPMSGSAQSGNPVVEIETSMGTITAELFRDKAPISVENFLAYASEGFYEGTVFHRVIKGFMIQGGGHLADMSRKASDKKPIKNEATNGLTNDRGTLAMARTPDVDSATAQFFINTVDNVPVNHRSTAPPEYGYAVFGRVTGGMDVVDKIELSATGTRGPFRDVPNETVTITAVRVKP